MKFKVSSCKPNLLSASSPSNCQLVRLFVCLSTFSLTLLLFCKWVHSYSSKLSYIIWKKAEISSMTKYNNARGKRAKEELKFIDRWILYVCDKQTVWTKLNWLFALLVNLTLLCLSICLSVCLFVFPVGARIVNLSSLLSSLQTLLVEKEELWLVLLKVCFIYNWRGYNTKLDSWHKNKLFYAK